MTLHLSAPQENTGVIERDAVRSGGPDCEFTGLADALISVRDDLMSVLTEISTRQSAEEEIFRSLRALCGAPWELRRYSPPRVRRVATFLPSNNVLYSYILFGVIPASYAEKVCMRPSARVTEVSRAVHEILHPFVGKFGRTVDMRFVSQREFIGECAESDVVVFTGHPENAVDVAGRLPSETLMLSFGSGPNPIVIGPEADLETACRSVVDARTYNSGQDCLCPDIVFVHRSIAAEATERLEALTAAVKVGDGRSPDTEVTSLVYPDATRGAAEFVDSYRDMIRYGGSVDIAGNQVEPTLIVLPWTDEFHPPELFSPIVVLMVYDDAGQIEEWLNTPGELVRGMYLSVYGEPRLERHRVGTCLVTLGCTSFDVEDGNRPFGGYGVRAGNVRRGPSVSGRPLLLSAEVRRGWS